ncbi:MAG: hypothetical protein O3C21_14940, partial [Verrucomicrobia bacterium]|nr:hypothetical protein [Verrucomicrobiota bacterium]
MTEINPEFLATLASTSGADDGDHHFSFRRLLGAAIKLRASDVHIDPSMAGFAIRMRIDGMLMEVTRLDHKAGMRLTNQLKAEVGIDP